LLPLSNRELFVEHIESSNDDCLEEMIESMDNGISKSAFVVSFE
jgi:hypothetical protein